MRIAASVERTRTLDDHVAGGRFIHSAAVARAKKSTVPKFPDFSASHRGVLPTAHVHGTPGPV